MTDSTPEPEWIEALGRAAEPVGASDPELVLFHEDRQDLFLRWSGGGLAEVRRARRSGLAATSGAGPDSLAFLAAAGPQDALALARAAAGSEAAIPDPTDRPVSSLLDPDLLSASRFDRFLGELARDLPRARVDTQVVAHRQRVLIARPGRPLREDLRQAARIRVQVRSSVGGRDVVAVAERAFVGGAARFDSVLDSIRPELVGRLERRRDARPARTGSRSVVCAPGVGGVLVHELVGHALEADTALGGRSWLAGAEGLVGNPALTVIDDPRRARAAWRIDDEGTSAGATSLLRDGRVDGWLHDERTAARANRKPTGHARRSSFRDRVLPRMGCTFVAAGSLAPDEVVGGVTEGVYVRRMEAATTDPRRGRATFRVTDADRIERGRLTHALDSFVLHVDAHRTLASMSRIATDLEFDRCIGSCHREGQTMAISVGAPTICLGLGHILAS